MKERIVTRIWVVAKEIADTFTLAFRMRYLQSSEYFFTSNEDEKNNSVGRRCYHPDVGFPQSHAVERRA